tara:strand:+ start:233 stop:1063 length:831 start_codon:yes stop_codon:yes gene_type:complete
MKKEIINYQNLNSKKIQVFSLKYKRSKPFPYIIIDNFLEKNFANKILDSFKLNSDWINYTFVNNFKKYGFNDRKKMNKNLNNLFNSLASKKFTGKLNKITNINGLFLDPKLDGGGLHQIFKGGYLNVHTDFSSHTNKPNWTRVLNILIYLNKNWKKSYKGNLELWSKDGRNKVSEISPKFNRCVVFFTNKNSFHGHPEKLNCPSNVSRKSIAAYYFVKNKINLKLSPTNYISRPNDNLKTRFLIGFDKNLNSIYSYLKRKNILNDKKITKILNLFS